MPNNNIFIHIPKTGGTTINCLLNNTEWQTTPDFNYRHIIYDTKRSNSRDIFSPFNYEKYMAYNIFMLVRNPIDRLVSEYYFMKDRNEFMSLLKSKPNNFRAYIDNKQTNNYMVGFLIGKRIYDENLTTEEDLELVINTIEALDIKVGIFEQYSKSLNYFKKVAGVKIPKKVDIKRITLNRPELETINEQLKKQIIKKNELDFKLYNYCLEKFKNDFEPLNIKDINVNFQGNKYNYILKYTERFNLLEIGLINKSFINTHIAFFNNLNLHLHKSLNLKKGEDYVKLWNLYFIKSMVNNFKNSKLTNDLTDINIDNHLDKTRKICDLLNKYQSTNDLKKYNKLMVFDKDLIEAKKHISKTSVFDIKKYFNF